MLLVGALVLAASALVLAWRDGNAGLVRLGYRSLLIGALPAWILMRVGAAWIASKEDLTDSNATWIGIGARRRRPRAAADPDLDRAGGSRDAPRAAVREPGPPRPCPGRTGLLLLIANLVAIWAMTTKPV